jgi:hypothetical protein
VRPALLTLTWHNLPEIPAGSVEVAFSRAAIAEAISRILPRLDVSPQRLTFVPIGDGRTQVNVHGFGAFGVLSS